MRFFSNEAKETDDENESAPADAATVPQQRSGSPWSDTPGSTSDPASDSRSDSSGEAGPVTGSSYPSESPDHASSESPDHASFESPDHASFESPDHASFESPDHASFESPDHADLNGSDALRTDDSEVRHDGDDLVRDDDAPHDDLDLPLDGRTTTGEDHSATDEFAAGTHRADDDATQPVEATGPVDASEPVDTAQHNGSTTTYGPDGSVTTADEPAGTSVDGLDRTDDERDVDEAAPVVATAPVGTTTTDDTTVDDSTEHDTAEHDSTVTDTAPVDVPVDVTPAADTAVDTDAVAATPVDAAATPVAAKPDPTANPVGDKLFTDGDSFNDRLREITFNFVDNPQEATQQAAGLVDEAIDKVTSSLKAQKDGLASDGNDTEKLRVELRGYRDILQRLTAL